MTSTVTFPSKDMSTMAPRRTLSYATELSLVSRQNAALEVCEFIYGNKLGATSSTSHRDAVDRYYEANASEHHPFSVLFVADGLRPVYENPLVTATSRSIIADIYALAGQLSNVEIPRPLAMLCTLFRLQSPEGASHGIPAMRIWSEVEEISESDFFDGHRKTLVEHKLNILVLPELHTDGTYDSRQRALSSISTSNSIILNDAGSPNLYRDRDILFHPPLHPSLIIPGTSLSIPSPLHYQLHIITKLSFNEQGRITHHRDIWDVKDVLGLVPGVSLVQWVGARLAAHSLALASRLLPSGRSKVVLPTDSDTNFAASGPSLLLRQDTSQTFVSHEDAQAGSSSDVSPATAYKVHAARVLGLGLDERTAQNSDTASQKV